ncbi:MAG: isoleucine--tRNA ligase, partial [Thermoanaerobaculia bacterium]
RKSLNLPQTAFPMRARLSENEPLSRKRWESRGLYRQILSERPADDAFVLHDGPPYANGAIHVGHLLNKVLKDLVVRSQTLSGRYCHYVPGWDCHGLPIEHRVMSELAAAGKLEKLDALAPDTRRQAIRRQCRRYADRFKALQAEQMQRLLTLADYDEPYTTMQPEYESAVLEVFAGLVEQGLVYRDLKPVHWSIANRTALAEAELEYRQREDPAVYVRFDATDRGAVAAAFAIELDSPPALMIWTTTPWTLPANQLIAVHGELRYSLVRFAQGSATVVATERLEAVAGLAEVAGFEVVGETRGENLVGLGYRHPFRDRRGRVVAADYVTVEDGTGLVHVAPGHGEEDYQTGLREGEEIYSPVGADGTFDDSVPEWLRGVLVWDANTEIVERLAASGHLFHRQRYLHSYPHDWRSKTPVIFRCTEQWFIAVDRPGKQGGRSLRELALAATGDEIRFVPEWGRNRLRGMLESRPDWCISRQRAWGLPIPAFRTADGSVLLTPASVRAVAEVVGREGSDAWFARPAAELLASYDPRADPEAPAGVDAGALEKMHDIFDVWFEAGSSWHAVLRRRGLGFPADLYLEGSDQHRGWFQLSLLPALGVTGRAPFKELVTHGFTVDKDGKKMSKSVGNALEVEELLRHYGADVCRWWVSSLAFENDLKVDLSYFDLASESYRKVRNTLRFLLGNLADFDPGRDAVDAATFDPVSIDAWALVRAAELRSRAIAAYRTYEFRRVHLLLFDFCNETLSAVYLNAVKDRLYCDLPGSPRRRATQTAFRYVADLLCALLAPILPHTADEAWRALTGDDDACVHLRTVPELPAVAADRGWQQVLAVRERALKALEEAKAGGGVDNPLDAGLVLPDPDGTLAPFYAELASVTGVSRVELAADAEAVRVLDLRGDPRCERSWLRDGTVRRRSGGGWLSDRDAEAVGAV